MRYPVVLTALTILAQHPFCCWPANSETNKPPAPLPVTLTVTARDPSRHPVSGLACAEFQIFEDNKPQPISNCSVLQSQRPTVVIVWDLLNSIRGHRGYASDLLVRALLPIKDADSVYLYLLTNSGDLYPFRPLSSQPGPNPWTQQIQPLLDQALQKITRFRPMDYQNEGMRAGTTFLKLDEIQRELTSVPGPRTVVWITTGTPNLMGCPYGCRNVSFPGDSETYLAGECTQCAKWGSDVCIDYSPFLRHFARDLQSSGISLYSVEETPYNALPRADQGSSKATLKQLSELTGGRLYARGEIGLAIADSITDSSARYQLWFAGGADGKYHRLRIESTRRNVRIEGPRGYFALRP